MATLNILTPTDFDNGIPEIWNTMLRYDSYRKAITTKMEGSENGSNMIIRKDDLSKQSGDLIHFDTLSRLKGKGRTAAQTLEGYEEKPTLGQFDLTVSTVRHAVAYRSDTKILSLFKPAEWARPQLAEWYGRKVMDDGCFKAMKDASTVTTLYAGQATTEATLAKLSGGDRLEYTLGVPELRKSYYSLLSIGADPIRVESRNGHEIPIYGILMTEFDMNNLTQDAEYKDINELANYRGETNPLFTMARGMVFGGLLIYCVPAIRGEGSPLRPEAKVYGAHTAAGTTITVGSETTGIIDYTADFASDGTLSIQNSAGAIEYVEYTAKTTYSFTGCTRGATYNGVTSTASTYTGAATSKEWITQGHGMSTSIVFGANAVMRGFANLQHEITQERDYSNEVGIGIASVHGHKEVLDSSGNVRNYLLLKNCAIAFDAA